MSLAELTKTVAFDDLSIYYPDGDGERVAESPDHLDCMIYGISVLKHFYAQNPDVWVAGNNFIYYEMNNFTVRVSPDMYVVFGVSKTKPRTSFFTWRENNITPSIVFEWTSESTKNEDKNRKKDLYEQVLRVPEYILFDPTGDHLKPNLQGYRLQNGVYVPLIPTAPGRLFSQVLGLELVAFGKELRFFDPVRRVYLDDYEGTAQRADLEAARARNEAIRADAEAQRADAEAQRAQGEAARADAAQQRANVEAAQRAEAENQTARAEAEAERLRALIAQLTAQNAAGAPSENNGDAT